MGIDSPLMAITPLTHLSGMLRAEDLLGHSLDELVGLVLSQRHLSNMMLYCKDRQPERYMPDCGTERPQQRNSRWGTPSKYGKS